MKKLIILLSLSFFAFTIKAQTPAMVLVEGGTFTMGGTESDEKPTHSVTVSSFSMGKYEVTVAEYKAFCTASGRIMPTAPPWGWNDKHPMANVSFDDANAFCNWLTETAGKNYRLPTEAEWEYAARGGSKSNGYIYAGSNDLDKVAWSWKNAEGQAQACGRKKPNELGLYDMSGNVSEWCKDWYDKSYYIISPSTNPQGPSSGTYRVNRGGNYHPTAAEFGVNNRGLNSPESSFYTLGFRVVVPQ